MKKVIVLGMLVFAAFSVFAQNAADTKAAPNSQANFSSVDFKGQFSVRLETIGENNVYLVDFSRLPSRFERVFFMNMTFGTQIVNLDPSVTDDRIRFMAHKSIDEKWVTETLDQLRERTRIASEWPEADRKKWLSENDKYNKTTVK